MSEASAIGDTILEWEAAGRRFSIREVSSMEEFHAVEEIQSEAWGFSELDVVPMGQLVAAKWAGGPVLGAFEGPRMIGFAYGFPAFISRKSIGEPYHPRSLERAEHRPSSPFCGDKLAHGHHVQFAEAPGFALDLFNRVELLHARYLADGESSARCFPFQDGVADRACLAHNQYQV